MAEGSGNPIYSKVAWPVVIGLVFIIAAQVARQMFGLDLGTIEPYIQLLVMGGTGYIVKEQA